MRSDDTDAQWELWGKQNPYYGVLSEDQFLSSNLSDTAMRDFFQSGHDYVQHALRQTRRFIDPEFAPRRAVDFGCGVGRIVIPLSGIAEQVVGVDVAESMLIEARRNCRDRGIKNADFILSDDSLSRLTGVFDLIHSFIVFQHIPVQRGEEILGQLLARLADGGVCIVHVPYARPELPPLRRFVDGIKRSIPFVHGLVNVTRGRNFGAPEMQMNAYDMNRLLLLMESSGVSRYFSEFTTHGGGIKGVLLYFQKEHDPVSARPTVLNVARG